MTIRKHWINVRYIEWHEFYESCPRYRINLSTFWPAVHHATTVQRLPPTGYTACWNTGIFLWFGNIIIIVCLPFKQTYNLHKYGERKHKQTNKQTNFSHNKIPPTQIYRQERMGMGVLVCSRSSARCVICLWFPYNQTNEINGALGPDSALVRLYWGRDNLG